MAYQLKSMLGHMMLRPGGHQAVSLASNNTDTILAAMAAPASPRM